MELTYPILFPAKTRFFMIVGCMKSGTTWLMNALDTHPEICSQGEMHPLEILDNPDSLVAPTLESVLSHDYALRRWYWMENSSWNRPYREGDKREGNSRQLDEDHIRFHFEWTMLRFLQGEGREIPAVIGDKSPSHTPYVARKIARYLGVYKPYVIHMVRDPRDVVTSRWFHIRRLQWESREKYAGTFRSDHDRQACRRLLENPDSPVAPGEPLYEYPDYLDATVQEWSSVNESLFRDGEALFGRRYRVLRYEDLKADFAGTMRPLLEAFEVDASAERLQEMEEKSDAKKLSRKPVVFRKGDVGDGLRHLSAPELEVVRRAAPVASRFGYDLEATRASAPAAAPAARTANASPSGGSASPSAVRLGTATPLRRT